VDLVFVESWQHECCGEPFAVGDEVSWPLRGAAVEGDHLGRLLGAEVSRQLTAEVDRHSEDAEPVRLRVVAVRAAFCEDEPVPVGSGGPVRRAVAGTTVFRELAEVDERYEVLDGLRWLGYVVEAQRR
jgi:hypothetical protein